MGRDRGIGKRMIWMGWVDNRGELRGVFFKLRGRIELCVYAGIVTRLG